MPQESHWLKPTRLMTWQRDQSDENRNLGLVQLQVGKLTCPLKINGWKMYFPIEIGPFFKGHVRFRGVLRFCSPAKWYSKCQQENDLLIIHSLKVRPKKMWHPCLIKWEFFVGFLGILWFWKHHFFQVSIDLNVVTYQCRWWRVVKTGASGDVASNWFR